MKKIIDYLEIKTVDGEGNGLFSNVFQYKHLVLQFTEMVFIYKSCNIC